MKPAVARCRPKKGRHGCRGDLPIARLAIPAAETNSQGVSGGVRLALFTLSEVEGSEVEGRPRPTVLGKVRNRANSFQNPTEKLPEGKEPSPAIRAIRTPAYTPARSQGGCQSPKKPREADSSETESLDRHQCRERGRSRRESHWYVRGGNGKPGKSRAGHVGSTPPVVSALTRSS